MKAIVLLATAFLKLAVIFSPAVIYVLAQQSRLHDAAASGDVEQVSGALKPWKSIDSMDREGRTALGVAVARRHEAVARFLLERGANPLPDAPDYLQPLGMVVAAKSAGLTRVFLTGGVSPDARLKSGRPWLLAAIEQRERAPIEALLAAGADPNARWSQNGEQAATPLSSALFAHADKDIDEGLAIAGLLLAKGAAVSGSDPALRRTIQHILSSRRYDTGESRGVERLQLLVEKGYPLEAPVPRDSLLSQAAYAGNLEAVRYLLAKGADPMGGAKPCREVKCPIDGSPLHRVAERYPMPKLGAIDQAIVQALLAAGADPHSPDQHGRTPAALAERSKNTAVSAALGATAPARGAAEAAVATSQSAKAAPAQRPLYAGHPGDPKSTDPRALLSAAGTELHAVVAYQPPRHSTAIDVELSAQGKPVTLFLAAYKTADWQIRVLPGVALSKVVALGQEPQRVRGVPAGTELVVRSARQHGSGPLERVYHRPDRDEMRRVVDRITEMAGAAPKSLIARHEMRKVAVDGTTTDIELSARPSGPPSAVTFATRPHEGKLSDDKLTAYYCCAGASSTVLASRGYRRGKRYFEAKLELPFMAGKPARWTNIGVLDGEGRDLQEDRNAFIGFAMHDRYKDGDVFGVAIDYDERVAYFRVNGKWVSGEPGSNGGLKLPSRGELFAAVSVASGREAWTANFGAVPFKSPPPPGYLPYAAPQ